MSNYFGKLPSEVKNNIISMCKNKTVFLPEGSDPRIISAAEILKTEFNVKSILGDADVSQKNKDKTISIMIECAEKRGKTLPEDRKILATDPTFYGGALLNIGAVDAVVSGCLMTTAHVIKAALSTVGLAPQSKVITSTFLLSLEKPTSGGESVVLFSDCGVIPNPTPEELSQIAFLSSQAYKAWINNEPKVSFLSFSTMGSANHRDVTKVQEGVKIFQNNHAEIISEGEVQFDAATVPEIALRKNPNTKVRGQTNVFIFPNLDAGNICYKTAQRLAGASAWGPILLGTSKPFSDLSRGASAQDIVHSVLLTLALKK